MAVSKHNQWKRQKNGLMKLVRSHSDWLQKRRETRARTKYIKSGGRTVVTNDNRTNPVVATNVPPNMAGKPSSTKRTQVGKKI